MFWKFFTVALGFYLIGAVAAQEAKSTTTEEVPAAAALATAEMTIKQIFKADYAKKKAADQVALSNKLLAQALETNDDLPAKYVLLREARDLACKGADLLLALKAVDEMVRSFSVVPLDEKLTTLELSQKSSSGVVVNKDIFDNCVNFADECVASDDYERAGKFLKVAQMAVATTGSNAQRSFLTVRVVEVDRIRNEHGKIQVDRDTLKTNPDDAEANLKVGRFLCFYKGDWMLGLPHLTKCSDKNLKELASKDLESSPKSADQLELADGWYAVAEGSDKSIQLELRLRALFWYKNALPELAGLTKVRIEKRIAEIDKIVALSGTTRPKTAPTIEKALVVPRVVATWAHEAGTGKNVGRSTIKLYSNGKINKPDSPHTWRIKGKSLTLTWKNPDAPGGKWVDECTLSGDGKSYSGKNNVGVPVRGVKLAAGDIDDEKKK